MSDIHGHGEWPDLPVLGPKNADSLSDGPGSLDVQHMVQTQGEVKLVLTVRLVGAGELVVESAHWEGAE